MSESASNSKSQLFSPSASSTNLIEVKCASERGKVPLQSDFSETSLQKQNRPPSIGSILEDRRAFRSQINGERTAPGDLLLDYSILSAGPDKFSEKKSPQYITSSKNMTLPFASSRESNHNRLPSLGQIHQSVEEEQEAQVNRLLQMIHNEQQHLWHLRNTNDQLSTHTTTDEVATAPLHHASLSPARSFQNIPRSIDTRVSHCSIDNNERPNPQRQDSSSSRKTASPGPAMTIEWKEDGESFAWSYRDDIAFYQAETQMMTRENQMLRRRIRELEMQINELSTDPQL